MNLLPVHVPSQSFIIVNNYEEEVERTDLMEFTFYGKDDIMTNYSCLLGRFIGSFHEESFQTKLWKVRGIMHIKGIRFSECVSRPFWSKEAIVKSDQQKYQKMYTQNYNKYIARLKAIEESSNLFKADDIKKENDNFNNIVNKLKERYNIQ